MSATTVNPVQTFEYDLSGIANPVTFGAATAINVAAAFGVYGAAGQVWSVTNLGNILGAVGIALETSSTIVNQQGGTIAGGSIGVELGLAGSGTGGGNATNNAGAMITGSSGIVVNGGAATITNGGTITGNLTYSSLQQNGQSIQLGDGIFAGAAATIVNLAGGTINGVFDGIRMAAGGTVTNGGTITSGSGYGIVLSKGGTVTNQAGASISGAAGGVIASGASAFINNAGSIVNSGGGEAVLLNAGGTVINAFGASIGSAGPSGNAIRIAGSAGAITNGGTIDGDIQFTGPGANALILQTGSFISGAIVGSTAAGATTGLVLQGVGSARNDFTNFNTLSVQASGTWTLGGNVAIAATTVSSGTLQVTGVLAGAVTIMAGATARFDSNFQGNVIFQGAGTLALAQAYSGTLTGFGASDIVDFTSLPYAANDTLRVVAGNALEIDSPGGVALASLRFDAGTALTAPQFALSSDSARGTRLTLSTIAAPSLSIASAGGATHSAQQIISGTIDAASAGLTVSVYDGATLLGSAPSNPDGTWSVAVALLASSAPQSITAQATNVAGNTGTSAAVVYQLQATTRHATKDFNSDGMSDILFRNDATSQTYLFTMNGMTVASGASTSTQAGGNWQINGIGDFNGDGASDLLWVYNNPSNAADGLNGISYISTQNGAAATDASSVVQQLPSVWQVAGIADFNGDGKADVLYRNTDTGALYLDIMNGAHVDYTVSGFTSQQIADQHWQIAGVADFDGDGKADILWRYDNPLNASDPLNGVVYEWRMNGLNVVSQDLISAQPGSDKWQVAGTGDFDGNGTADILFRYNDTTNPSAPLNGFTYIDFMNGTQVTSGAPTQWQIDNSWTIASIGDFNGDGKSDLLFQQAGSGSTYIWDMNGVATTAGGFTSSLSGPGWTVQNGVLDG